MRSRLSRRRRILPPLRWCAFIILVVHFLPAVYQVALYYVEQDPTAPWWSLRRDSSGQAPDLLETEDAIIQVYAARAVRWRGALGVHAWVATRHSHQLEYQRIEVLGFALRWGGQRSVRIHPGVPDQYWYGSQPVLLREIRGGQEVDELINRIHHAARRYPYDTTYDIWPGPNSNTFVAYLGRQVPELSLDLPPNAIGKDYPTGGSILQTPPSGRGFQVTLGGLAGLLLSPEEGLEINLLGLTAGIDFSPLALKLPAVGRIGFQDLERRILP